MLGNILLGVGLFFALGAAIAYGIFKDASESIKRGLVLVSAVAVIMASVYLMVLIFGDRFDIAYVASYSDRALSPVYKFSAFWAGQQGSFLLWLLIHAVASLLIVFTGKRAGAFSDNSIAAFMTVEAALFILLLGKSPFLPSEVIPNDGNGMNPLLQDPWMAIHPPIIFIGYALLAIPFSLSMGSLFDLKAAPQTASEGTKVPKKLAATAAGVQDAFSSAWLETARKWTLIAWAFLGAGIFIGGFWAYKVLGWGGYWGWDPVENSSLVPWLIAGILLHLLKLSRIRPDNIVMTHLSAIFAFSAVIYGTFLTRSGILGDFSVHSFAGTSIGMVIACVNAVVLIGGLVILLMKMNRLPQGELYSSYSTRDFMVLLGMLVIAFITAIIFLGMSMPLLTQLVNKPAAVDNSFYVRLTMPLAIVMLGLMMKALQYVYGAKNAAHGEKARKLIGGGEDKTGQSVMVLAFVAGAAFVGGLVGIHEALPVVLGGIGVSATAASVLACRKHILSFGGLIAHAGVGLGLFAMVLAGNGSLSVTQPMETDTEYTIFGHKVTYVGQEFKADFASKDYIYIVDGKEVRALTKLRQTGEDAAREPAIAKSITGDVYIAPSPPQTAIAGYEEHELKRGKHVMDEAFAYLLDNVESVQDENNPNRHVIKATLTVTDGIRMEQDTMELIDTGIPGQAESHPMDIMDGEKRVRLTGVSNDLRAIRFETMPSSLIENKLAVSANVSTKPYIWLLWVSAAMASVGCLIAIKK